MTNRSMALSLLLCAILILAVFIIENKVILVSIHLYTSFIALIASRRLFMLSEKQTRREA